MFNNKKIRPAELSRFIYIKEWLVTDRFADCILDSVFETLVFCQRDDFSSKKTPEK